MVLQKLVLYFYHNTHTHTHKHTCTNTRTHMHNYIYIYIYINNLFVDLHQTMVGRRYDKLILNDEEVDIMIC